MLELALIFGDAHRPFHHQRAWDLVLQVTEALRPDWIWNLGDWMDCFSISTHSKDPSRKLLLADEVEVAKQGLAEIEQAAPGAERIYTAGNHEDRLRRYLQDKAPELYGMMDIPSILDLGAWTYVPYKNHKKVGKLHLTHDVGNTGRQAAFRALDTYQHSVLTGHCHRLAYVVEGNAVGECKLSATFGWLGDVEQVDYMHKATALKNWALGFGIAYLDTKGLAYVTPIPILPNGKKRLSCVVNGTLYTA